MSPNIPPATQEVNDAIREAENAFDDADIPAPLHEQFFVIFDELRGTPKDSPVYSTLPNALMLLSVHPQAWPIFKLYFESYILAHEKEGLETVDKPLYEARRAISSANDTLQNAELPSHKIAFKLLYKLRLHLNDEPSDEKSSLIQIITQRIANELVSIGDQNAATISAGKRRLADTEDSVIMISADNSSMMRKRSCPGQPAERARVAASGVNDMPVLDTVNASCRELLASTPLVNNEDSTSILTYIHSGVSTAASPRDIREFLVDLQKEYPGNHDKLFNLFPCIIETTNYVHDTDVCTAKDGIPTPWSLIHWVLAQGQVSAPDLSVILRKFCSLDIDLGRSRRDSKSALILTIFNELECVSLSERGRIMISHEPHCHREMWSPTGHLKELLEEELNNMSNEIDISNVIRKMRFESLFAIHRAIKQQYRNLTLKELNRFVKAYRGEHPEDEDVQELKKEKTAHNVLIKILAEYPIGHQRQQIRHLKHQLGCQLVGQTLRNKCFKRHGIDIYGHYGNYCPQTLVDLEGTVDLVIDGWVENFVDSKMSKLM